MKARKVKGLDPDGPLAEQAARIVRVRLDELCSFGPAAMDPDDEKALHDMRIAAKRLRYVLDVTAKYFGAYAATARRRAREIQDQLGEIHDCDVLVPEVEARLAKLRAADAERLAEIAGEGADLGPEMSARAAHRLEYRGLEVLGAHLAARRVLLHRRFCQRWRRLEARGFRERLLDALEEMTATPILPSGGDAPVASKPTPARGARGGASRIRPAGGHDEHTGAGPAARRRRRGTGS